MGKEKKKREINISKLIAAKFIGLTEYQKVERIRISSKWIKSREENSFYI